MDVATSAGSAWTRRSAAGRVSRTHLRLNRTSGSNLTLSGRDARLRAASTLRPSMPMTCDRCMQSSGTLLNNGNIQIEKTIVWHMTSGLKISKSIWTFLKCCRVVPPPARMQSLWVQRHASVVQNGASQITQTKLRCAGFTRFLHAEHFDLSGVPTSPGCVIVKSITSSLPSDPDPATSSEGVSGHGVTSAGVSRRILGSSATNSLRSSSPSRVTTAQQSSTWMPSPTSFQHQFVIRFCSGVRAGGVRLEESELGG